MHRLANLDIVEMSGSSVSPCTFYFLLRFTSVMMLVTFKLSTHTKFWSFLLFFSIIVLSLGLYFAYMWISNYNFSNYVIGNTYMFFTQAETYFIVLFCSCFVLCVDGIVLSFDSKYSGVINKMRILISG